ncbi:hypothetical protein caldi_26040 [Caldinitratiruptor microaerophilus]|uniref:Uncharacterized protein n=1 Tax=Caldinitratiruptor microaerophilus TaxID=671077 RepID=A0AA35CLH3_9FIRM|nr:hypothetical protein caldi_26040 [Caldinitratiruptor microaerophilus]
MWVNTRGPRVHPCSGVRGPTRVRLEEAGVAGRGQSAGGARHPATGPGRPVPLADPGARPGRPCPNTASDIFGLRSETPFRLMVREAIGAPEMHLVSTRTGQRVSGSGIMSILVGS